MNVVVEVFLVFLLGYISIYLKCYYIVLFFNLIIKGIE